MPPEAIRRVAMLHLRMEVLVRIAADLIVVNLCVFLSLVPHALLRNLPLPVIFRLWYFAAGLLSVLAPIVFYLMGFYTKGRSYSSKYKALVVAQAAAILYLLLAIGLYFFRLHASFPRSSFLLAWAACTSALIGTRLWSSIWKRFAIREVQLAASSSADMHDVLVIGGAGYVGSALLPQLLQRGYRVRLLDCFLYGDAPIRAFARHPNLEIQRGDFRNVDTVVAAMKGMGSVVHLGGLVGDPACALDEELTIQVNLIATRMIAQVAKGDGVSRFVFASSCSVYGASDEFLDERSALRPVSLYARSKIASEGVLLSMADRNFTPVILRFGTIYGLSGRTRFDLVVNLLVAKALKEGVITVYGRDQWRPFVHVHDAARAVLLALDARSETLSPLVFNVGSNEQNRTLGQVGEMIRDMVPGSVLLCTEENVDRRNYRVDFQRIAAALRFEPRWDLVSGVNQVIDALRSGEVVDYLDPQYSNARYLSRPDARRRLGVMEDWVPKFLQYPPVKPEEAVVTVQPS